MKQRIILALAVIITGVISCSKDSDSSIPETASYINFFSAVPGVSYDVEVDTSSIGTDIGYGEATGYHSFEAKRYTLSIYAAGDHTTLIGGGQISLRNDHYYSVYLSKNHNGVLQLLLVEDKLQKATAGYGRIKVVDLSDTYYSSGTQQLLMDYYIDSTRRFQNINYLAATAFTEVPAGTREQNIRWAGSSIKIVSDSNFLYNNSAQLAIEDQKSYSIIAYGNAFVADSFKLAIFTHEK